MRWLVTSLLLVALCRVEGGMRRCYGECFGSNPCRHKTIIDGKTPIAGGCSSSDDCDGVSSCGTCWDKCKGRKWGKYGDYGTHDETDEYGGDYSMPDVDYEKPPGPQWHPSLEGKRRKRALTIMEKSAKETSVNEKSVKEEFVKGHLKKLQKRSPYYPSSEIPSIAVAAVDGPCTTVTCKYGKEDSSISTKSSEEESSISHEREDSPETDEYDESWNMDESWMENSEEKDSGSIDPGFTKPNKSSGPTGLSIKGLRKKRSPLTIQNDYNPTRNWDITCTFECQRSGACSHSTRYQSQSGSGSRSGTCVRRGVICMGGRCCAGETPECGRCWDYCGDDKIGTYVEEGPLGRSGSSSSSSEEDKSINIGEGSLQTINDRWGSVSVEPGSTGGGSSMTFEEGGSISIDPKPRMSSGPTGLSNKGSGLRSRSFGRRPSSDITCTFECHRSGACSHNMEDLYSWYSGTCIRKGVPCFEGRCCAGQRPECGRCWEYCKGGKIGRFVEEGPLRMSDSSGSSSSDSSSDSSSSSSSSSSQEVSRPKSEITCTFQCQGSGQCSHRMESRYGYWAGSCAPRGVHCLGKCCAGQTPECGKCRDYCGDDKNGEYVIEGPIEKSDSSSSGSKEDSSISIDRPKPNPKTDITCTFECQRSGACSHSTRYQSQSGSRSRSGSCVRRGVICMGGRCCAGETPECGRCWDYCGDDKLGTYYEEGPLRRSGSGSSSEEGGSISIGRGSSIAFGKMRGSIDPGFTQMNSGPTGGGGSISVDPGLTQPQMSSGPKGLP